MRVIDYDPSQPIDPAFKSLSDILENKKPILGTVVSMYPFWDPVAINKAIKPYMKRKILKTTVRRVKGQRVLVIKHDRFKCFLNSGPTRFSIKLEKKYYDRNEKW